MLADMMFDAFETDMRSRRVGTTALREFRIVRVRFRGPFRDAVDEYEPLGRNPCRRVRLPPVPRRDVVTISNKLLREIRTSVRNSQEAAVFALFAFTGMRLSEVRQLEYLTNE